MTRTAIGEILTVQSRVTIAKLDHGGGYRAGGAATLDQQASIPAYARHVLWPEGSEATPFAGPFEWFSLLLTIAAFVALWRFKVGVIPVLAACALAGLGYSLLG
ncbi:MAG: hypothetical protein KFB96_22080 [Thiocapsa sp.]|nr:MAG: hypothetical protein KFB96_22080 [Thiocapsa sp.]